MKFKKSIVALMSVLMLFVVLSYDVVLAANGPSSRAVIIEPTSDLVGTYVGTYNPRQGLSGMTLDVFYESGKVYARWYFYSLPGKTNTKNGNILMEVTYDEATSKYTLLPIREDYQPAGYTTLKLYGTLSGDAFYGTSECKFDLRRKSDYQKDMEQKLVGQFQGTYNPRQGLSGMLLDVYSDGDNVYARWNFYSLPGKTNTKSGSVLMLVSYDTSINKYVLRTIREDFQPEKYGTLSLTGTVTNDKFTGTADCAFTLTRI